MTTVNISFPSEVLYMNCRTCGDPLPVGLRSTGYCETHRAPGEIEYYFCFVCSDRLPVTRRLHGVHEECAPYYFPDGKYLRTKARAHLAAQRRKTVAEMMNRGVGAKDIAITLGLPITTINNDIHKLRTS